jgi:thiol-disulfide isomerase/thioredoxin
MNLKYCLTVVLCLYLKSDARQTRPLTIGDKVPGLEIKNICNTPALQSNFSAFKNKLLILDFMGTTCIGCIKGLPILDSLQKKYGNKIQIVLVTNEPLLKVKPFLKRYSVKFPVIYNDSVLSMLFPHTFIPHDVWINKGIVTAITYPEYVNEKNINAVLSNEKVDLPVKYDIAEFDYTQPLIHVNEQNVPEGSYPSHMYYSWFGSNMDNIPNMEKMQPDSEKQCIKISFVNMPVIDLYLRSYGLFHIADSRIILEVKDTGHYVFNKNKNYRQAWVKQNTFCYEAVLPFSMPVEKRHQKLREDLDMFTGLQGRMEQRNMLCRILIRTDTAAKLQPVYSVRKVPDMVSLSYIVYMLDHIFSAMPAIDETGFKKAWIKGDDGIVNDLPLLQETLQKYGLQFFTKERKIDVLVLSGKNYSTLK